MSRGSRAPRYREPLMFGRLAAAYDALCASKDTAREAARLDALARRYGRSGGTRWLDVACGAGRHLEFLRHRYDVVGLDRSRSMLRLARRRLPTTRLLLGDMRSFDLTEQFDVVSCLYSAVGHLGSVRELSITLRNFARHLRPGGICVIEPWLDPRRYSAGFVQLVSRSGPDGSIARMAISRPRRGHRSRIHYEYLLGDPAGGIRHFAEDVSGLMVRPDRFRELLVAAGLRPRFIEAGLTPGRGLQVGLKPRVQGQSPTALVRRR